MGYAIFNEKFVSYDDGKADVQIATFVHEVLHGLFFHPKLFEYFPTNKFGQSFLFEDNESNFKLRGNNILNFLKEHFNCSLIDGGNFILNFFKNSSFGKTWRFWFTKWSF